MVFTNKKGEMSIAAIVGWIIGLALLAIIIFAVFQGWGPFKQTVSAATSCKGTGFTGTCVGNESSCTSGIVIDGLGCQAPTPLCCAQNV